MATREGHTDGESQMGTRVPRREDYPLITGQSHYTDDHSVPRMTHASILRSQYGHARIEDIDTSAAEAMDGVVAVFTGEDVEASGVPGTIPTPFRIPEGDEFSLNTGPRRPDRPILARGVVRYTGEPVAVVVAEDRYTANEAARRVAVSYERLDAVTDPMAALDADAPRLHEEAPDNVVLDWEVGDADAVDDAFAAADRTVEIDLTNQRLSPTAMEPRAALADYTPSTGDLTVTMGSQCPHDHLATISDVLDVPERKLRVVSPDVGGGFGLKSKYYPGEILAAWSSMQLGRPVKWQATRSESFHADLNGRGHDTHAELALDDDGRFRGLRARTHIDMGGYLSKVSLFIATGAYGRLLSNQYEIPAIHCRTIGVFTNKAPMDAYRGAGRPEAAYVVERLVRKAAGVLDVDPAEIRRRNHIPPDDFPYATPLGVTYDSGDYGHLLDTALDAAGYDDLRERQRALLDEGRYLGIGLGCFVESAGLPGYESSTIRFHPDGGVTAIVGSHDHGQGHETTFSQILADELGVAYDEIDVDYGDTDQSPSGVGTFGSRTAIAASTSIVESAEKVIEQARRVAAHRFEAAEADVAFEDGEFYVEGAPSRAVHIQEIARDLYAGEDLPAGSERGLEATSFAASGSTYPYGIHVVAVEVDPSTGEVDFERYVAVDDCGEIINPTIVEGQVHGGIAQGLGQALLEEVVYDANGSLTTGTLMEYAVPRAHHLPDIETDHTVTPSPTNPLGVKGIGEAGTIAAPVAIVNAVVDALEPLGVDHVEMPVTPETIWRAVDDA